MIESYEGKLRSVLRREVGVLLKALTPAVLESDPNSLVSLDKLHNLFICHPCYRSGSGRKFDSYRLLDCVIIRDNHQEQYCYYFGNGI